MGPKMLVVKRGEYGALLFTQDSIFAAPAFPLEVVFDPTGAGDSFAGGMVGYVASHNSLEQAFLRQGVVMGSTMASFAVEDFSLDRFRTLSQQEIAARYEEFRGLMRF
jgi:sugar/nucleoside kinase (ribokinase family)